MGSRRTMKEARNEKKKKKTHQNHLISTKHKKKTERNIFSNCQIFWWFLFLVLFLFACSLVAEVLVFSHPFLSCSISGKTSNWNNKWVKRNQKTLSPIQWPSFIPFFVPLVCEWLFFSSLPHKCIPKVMLIIIYVSKRSIQITIDSEWLLMRFIIIVGFFLPNRHIQADITFI